MHLCSARSCISLLATQTELPTQLSLLDALAQSHRLENTTALGGINICQGSSPLHDPCFRGTRTCSDELYPNQYKRHCKTA